MPRCLGPDGTPTLAAAIDLGRVAARVAIWIADSISGAPTIKHLRRRQFGAPFQVAGFLRDSTQWLGRQRSNGRP